MCEDENISPDDAKLLVLGSLHVQADILGLNVDHHVPAAS